MIELNEFIFRKINLPKRFWFTTPLTMNQNVRSENESFIREWLSKWSEQGTKKEDLFIMGPHANDLFSVTIQAVARRGIDIMVFHPGEIDIAIERNPAVRSDWFDAPLLGIHAFFEDQSYDFKTRNLLYSLIKHRWLNEKPTVLATTTEKDRLPDYMNGAECLEGFLKSVAALRA